LASGFKNPANPSNLENNYGNIKETSAAICDKKGKAIPREGGGYCICPHALTVPLNTVKPDKKAMKKGLEDALRPLIIQTVNWHKNLIVLENLLVDWENPKKEVKS